MRHPWRLPLSFMVLSTLAACGCVDEYVGEIPSPDGTLKAELRHCGCRINTYRRTQVTVIEASRKAECMSSTGIAGFDAPLDHAPLQIRWLSNDTLQASYPGYPGFPHMHYSAGDPDRPRVNLLFPQRAADQPGEGGAQGGVEAPAQ